LNYPHEGHAIHGFLYDQPFQTTGTTIARDSASVVLSHAYRGEHQGFPFAFDTRICYKLNNGTGLSCTAEVINSGAVPMPLGIGWHPYVTLGKPIDSLRLRIPGAHKVVLGPDMIPTGDVAAFGRFLAADELGAQMLDDTFEVDVSDGTVGTDLTDPEAAVTVQVWQDCHRGQFRYVHVYTSPDRRSVAIEPMTCWADAFNNQRGLVILRPGESTMVRCGVRIF
jgi:aldose 1-epimerase